MKHWSVYFIFFVFFPLSVGAQQMIAKQMPFFYQLSSNEIWDIYQDREGFLWIATTNGLVRYDGYRLQSFRAEHRSPDLLTNNSIVCLTDNEHYVWIGTRKGLNLYDKKTGTIFPVPEKILQDKLINAMVPERDGFIWVAAEGKMYKCNSDGSIVKEYIIPGIHTDRQSVINSVYKDKKEDIWVLSDPRGLFKYDFRMDTFVNHPSGGEGIVPFIMYQDKDDNYWIGTWGRGLCQFFPEASGGFYYKSHPVMNVRNGEPEPIVFSITQDDVFGYIWLLSYNELYALRLNQEGSLEQVDIHDLLDTHKMFTRIFKDRTGNLWLSSYDMAYTIFFDRSGIENYSLPQLKERLGWDANLLHLCMGKDNVMWFMQDRYGLCLYDLSQNKLSHNDVSVSPDVLSATILAQSVAKGIWAGDWGGKVRHLVNQEMKIEIEEEFRLSDFVPDPGEITQLIEDKEQNVWILTTTRLFIKPMGKHPVLIADQNSDPVSCIAMDRDGYMWGITTEQKLFRLHFHEDYSDFEQVSEQRILSSEEEIKKLCIDGEGCVWIISSWGKIYKSNRDKSVFEDMPLEYKLEDSSVLNLLSDQNNVWIITNKKVLRYDIRSESLFEYSTADGNILVNVFRYKAGTPDGKNGIFVGGHGGFIHLQTGPEFPEQIKNYPYVIGDVTVGNKSLFFPNKVNSNRTKNTTDKIFLEATDRNIEIYFSSPNYSLTPPDRIAYKLEGVDKEWTYPDTNKNSAFYNQLGKGTYRFLLKYEYENGKWTDGTVLLIIEKEPAFYETWYAWLGYVILTFLGIYLILRSYLKRMQVKNEKKIKEELDKTKLDYFTNISHEILTPLTIISCAIDNLENAETNGSKEKILLKSNVEKLKRLIRQILDFRKMEAGKMNLHVSFGNISDFIRNICQNSFVPLAQKRDITLQITISPDDLSGYLDFEKIDKIIYNLLSNAIKYTPENKRIVVDVKSVEKGDQDFLVINIQDEGKGIMPEEMDRIFERFYMNRHSFGVESNGIGLSLTKDLVTLHHGTISVVSQPGTGSCFTVEIPISKETYPINEWMENRSDIDEEEVTPENGLESDTSDHLTILLVDDNTELLYLMQGILKKKYSILTATNGDQAWEYMNDQTVDMVICDVMMPGKNGWEFCNRIKTDLRFNHIPVLILTARNTIEDRVTSYEAGADAYIAKPFELKVLFARVNNLLMAYKKRQVAFQKEENINLDHLPWQSADKQFLQSFIDSIEQHLEESEFDLDRLATALNISKSTLHRKVKSITGLTPMDFVRNIKMKRACMMLLTGKQTISEIAYALGFSNPKYFSKCFKEEFGITPSEYQQKHR